MHGLEISIKKTTLLDWQKCDWILSLDADERLSPELIGEIQEAVCNPGNVVGFFFPRRSFYLGRWIYHGDWYPDHQLRLFKRGCGQWQGTNPHGRVIVDGKTNCMKHDIYHFNYKNFSHQLKTIDNYSNIFADVMIEKNKGFSLFQLFFRPLCKFIKVYFIKMGFLDGLPGFILAVSNAFYIFVKYVKLWEKRIVNTFQKSLFREKRFYRKKTAQNMSTIKKIYSSVFPGIYTFLCKTRLPYYPSKISIESGNLCNLRCPLCPTGQQDKSAKKGFISFDLFKKVVDEMGQYLTVIRLYNWGEPMLNKDLLRMTHYAKEREIDIKISTNLSMKMEDGQIEALVKAGLEKIYISCNGASSESYLKYHVGGDFDLVMDNMKRLVQKKREIPGCHTRLVWLFHVFKHNEHEIAAAKELAQKNRHQNQNIKNKARYGQGSL